MNETNENNEAYAAETKVSLSTKETLDADRQTKSALLRLARRIKEKMTNGQYKRYTIPKTTMLEEAIQTFTPIEKFIFWILLSIFSFCAVILIIAVNNSLLVQVPVQGGTLTEGIIGTPNFINPLFTITDGEKDISSLIYSGLMKDGPNGSLLPDLARSYTVSSDGRTYIFNLKNNVYFHDGVPVTADDIAFTISKATDPDLKSPRAANWDGVKVQVLGPHQIQFTLTQPYASFIYSATMGILPKHIWGNIVNDQFSQLLELTGSGPYELDSITRDSSGIPTSYTLNAFDQYANGAPYIKNIVFKFYSSENDALAAYKKGDIQSIGSISPESVSSFVPDIRSASSQATIKSIPLPRLFGIFFNQNQAPVFVNKEVRQALSMVVNRQAIIDKVLDGYGIPISEPLPYNAMAYIETISPATSTIMINSETTTSSNIVSGQKTKTSNVKSISAANQGSAAKISQIPSINIFGTTTVVLDQDQQTIVAAKRLLTENGWALNPSDGLLEKVSGKTTYKLQFSIYTSNTPELLETANLLKEQWQSIGAVVTIKSFELGDLNETVIRPRKYDVLLFGEDIDQDTDLYSFWDSSQRNDPGLNIAMYVNSKTDKILEQLRTTLDPENRKELIQQFEDQFDTDIPAVFIYSPDFIYIMPKDLKNVTINDINSPSDRFDTINQWYMDTENIWKIFANK